MSRLLLLLNLLIRAFFVRLGAPSGGADSATAGRCWPGRFICSCYLVCPARPERRRTGGQYACGRAAGGTLSAQWFAAADGAVCLPACSRRRIPTAPLDRAAPERDDRDLACYWRSVRPGSMGALPVEQQIVVVRTLRDGLMCAWIGLFFFPLGLDCGSGSRCG